MLMGAFIVWRSLVAHRNRRRRYHCPLWWRFNRHPLRLRAPERTRSPPYHTLRFPQADTAVSFSICFYFVFPRFLRFALRQFIAGLERCLADVQSRLVARDGLVSHFFVAVEV
jgi:hypothetical protein